MRHSELKGKRIFVTGHTGFTGSWASIWLNLIGAEVYGYSLEPETSPNLFTEANVKNLVGGTFSDIRDFEHLMTAISNFQPDLILHLAAQPLVRRGYKTPRETFETNAQGTANVLEAARLTPSVKGVLCITTDKVYKNLEVDYHYVESDDLGGKDPYSASKAAAELIIQGYRDSIRSQAHEFPIISVARGGNIVGGGDWSEDRLIPDYIRSYESGKQLTIRYPNSTRPWQHVLSLIEGYLQILSGMLGKTPQIFDRAFNLGPIEPNQVSVAQVLELISKSLPGVAYVSENANLPEAGKLGLNSHLAQEILGWNPKWTTQEVLEKTTFWYSSFLADRGSAYALCKTQIAEFGSAE
jgi:CDP-glucose 4,6-dehydratase